MKTSSYFHQISENFSVNDRIQMISITNHDRLFKNWLQKTDVLSTVITKFGANLDQWNFAELGLFTLGSEIDQLERQLQDKNTIAKAIRVYDRVRSGQVTNNFEEATLLAIALFMRWQKTEKWHGIFSEIRLKNQVNDRDLFINWKTAFAVLYNLTSDPNELLDTIFAETPTFLGIDFVIHIYSCQFDSNQMKAKELSKIISSQPVEKQIDWFQKIDQYKPEYQKELAYELSKMLKRTDQKTIETQDFLDTQKNINLNVRNSLLSHLNGETAHAKSFLEEAQRSANKMVAVLDTFLLGKKEHGSLEEIWQNPYQSNSILQDVFLSQQEDISAENLMPYLSEEYWGFLLKIEKIHQTKEQVGISKARELIRREFKFWMEMLKSKTSEIEKLVFLSQFNHKRLFSVMIDLSLNDLVIEYAEFISEYKGIDKSIQELLANIYQTVQKYDRAYEYLKNDSILHPDDIQRKRKIINLFIQENDSKTIYDEWQSFSAKEKMTNDDWLIFAKAACETGDYDKTRDIAQNLLDQKYKYGESLLLLARIELKTGSVDEAKKKLVEITECEPEIGQAWSELAKLYHDENKYEEAINLLRSAVLAAPDDPEIHFSLAIACNEQQQFSEAVPYFRKAITICPDNEKYYLPTINTLRLLGRIDEADQYLTTARMKWPSNAEIAFLDAQRHLDNEKTDQALLALENAIDSAGDETPAEWHFLYAKTLLGDDNSNSLITENGVIDTQPLLLSQKSLQRALVNENQNGYGHLLLAEVFYLLGEYEAAHSKYCALIEPEQTYEHLEGLDWRVFAGTGYAKLAIGELDSGLVMLAEATKENPTNIGILKKLAETYLIANLEDDAYKTANDIYSLCSDDPNFLIWYADFMKKMDQSDEVLKALEQGMQVSTHNPELINRLAVEYVVTGQENDAYNLLLTLDEIENAEFTDFRSAAITLLRINKKEAALKLYQQGFGKLDQEVTVPVWLEFVYLNMLNQKWEEALIKLHSLLTQFPDYRLLHSLVGICLEKLEKWEGAITSLENAQKWDLSHQGLLSKSDENISLIPSDWFNQFEDEKFIRLKTISTRMKISEFPLALKELEDVINDYPDELILRLWGIELSIKIGDLVTAEEHLHAALDYLQNKQDEIDPILKTLVFSYNHYIMFCLGKTSSLEITLDQAVGDLVELAKIFNDLENGNYHKCLLAHNQIDINGEKHAVLPGFEKDAMEITSYLEAKNIERLEILVSLMLLDFNKTNKTLLSWGKVPDNFQESQILRMFFLLHHETYASIFQKLGFDHHYLPEFRNPTYLTNEMSEFVFRNQGYSGKNTIYRTFEKVLRIRENPDAANIQPLLMQSENPIIKTWLIAQLINIEEIDLAYQWLDDPNQVDSYLIYSGLIADKMPEKSLEALEKIESATSPVVYLIQAFVFERSKQTIEAISAYKKASEIWPEDSSIQIKIAELSQQVGDIVDAKYHYQQALSSACEKQGVILPYAKLLTETGEYDKAIQLLDNFKDHIADKANFFATYANVAIERREMDEAHKALQELRNLGPNDSLLNYLEGKYFYNTSQKEKAIHKLKQSIEKDPQRAEAYYLLISLLEESKQYIPALTLIDDALENLEDSQKLLIEKVWILRAAGNLDEAEILVRQLIGMYPNNGNLLGLGALIFNEKGNQKEAEKAARKSIRINENQPAMHLLIGQILRKQGHLDQALEHMSIAAKLLPDSIDPCLEMGSIYLEQRSYSKALDAYHEAIKRNDKDARAFTQAGLIMRDVKDYQGAEKMLRIAADLSPKDANIRRQLAGVIALNFVHAPLEAK